VIDPSTEQMLAEPTDMLAPFYADMRAGIDLKPAAPRIRDLIVAGYRELLEANTYLGNAAECAHIKARLFELGANP